MTSSLRPPYHHDVSTIFSRLAAAISVGIAAAALCMILLSGTQSRAADTWISAKDALERQREAGMTIIDIRRPEEWRQTGVPAGAERATIRSAHGTRGFLQRIAEITKGDKYMHLGLICAAGVRSNLALRLLQKQGYHRVVDISEGMMGNARGSGWLAAGLPVTPCPDC